jgi:hypothetical protein
MMEEWNSGVTAFSAIPAIPVSLHHSIIPRA